MSYNKHRAKYSWPGGTTPVLIFEIRTRPMLNQQPSLTRRIYAGLVADRGPGKKKLWVLIAIPLSILGGLMALAVLGVYIWLARGLPSIEWAHHYRPPIVTTVWSGDEQL